ncbi:MAG: hypothetical protein MI974_26930, partial [Chitinophagales bacterium]|nr:hypothetical protein [Chitinophagales bacterium]
MQPIPVKVKNVNVYAYFPNQPLIEEVITGASGTFSGALTATSGTIGGWKINSSAMYSGTYQGSNAYTS